MLINLSAKVQKAEKVCNFFFDNFKHSYFTIIIYRNSCLFPLTNNTMRDVVVSCIIYITVLLTFRTFLFHNTKYVIYTYACLFKKENYTEKCRNGSVCICIM